MSKIYLVLFSILSLNLYANDPSKACLSFDFDSNKHACIDILNKGYVAENAAMYCVTLDFDSNKLTCLNATIGKKYSEGALELCESFDFDSSKVQCIAKSGVKFDENEERKETIRLINLHANKAKALIYRGDLGLAIESLNQIILLISSL